LDNATLGVDVGAALAQSAELPEMLDVGGVGVGVGGDVLSPKLKFASASAEEEEAVSWLSVLKMTEKVYLPGGSEPVCERATLDD
jgi:hypothetical protein